MKKYLRATRDLIAGDRTVRFELLTKIASALFPDYRFKSPQLDWWENKPFTSYLDLFNETKGMNTDRRWMLNQLMRLTMGVPGDTAECGVYKGASSYLICSFNASVNEFDRHHFVFDSFEGLSEPSNIDGSYWTKGDLVSPLETARTALAEFNSVSFLKGWIPSRFPEISDKTFSFVHIDVDLYEPTRDSIEFFYPRMAPGGVILCDDYGWTTCPGATKAIDEFLESVPEKMISLCSGGGFMIKGHATYPQQLPAV